MTPDLHYTDSRLARLYDQDCGPDCNAGADSAFYLSLAGPAPQRILDLGCGTGILSNAYAALGHQVTGVDPAAAMLDVARTKPHADHATWVNTPAQSFHSPTRFDLIVMTGHAFQVLLSDADIAATLTVMRDHVAPGGTIAFETRNPAMDWAQRWHGMTLDHLLDGQPVHQSFHVSAENAGHITFRTHYAFPDAALTSESTLRFHDLPAVTAMLAAHGLQIRATFGDWHRAPYDSATSDEIIILAAPA